MTRDLDGRVLTGWPAFFTRGRHTVARGCWELFPPPLWPYLFLFFSFLFAPFDGICLPLHLLTSFSPGAPLFSNQYLNIFLENESHSFSIFLHWQFAQIHTMLHIGALIYLTPLWSCLTLLLYSCSLVSGADGKMQIILCPFHPGRSAGLITHCRHLASDLLLVLCGVSFFLLASTVTSTF